MQKENPLDRFARWVRGPAIAGLYVSVPVALISYGWLIKMMIEAAPFWVSALVITAHLAAWLGIASLFDKRQGRQ